MKFTNWRHMIEQIASLTEEALKDSINEEVKTLRRKDVVVRLHQRYSKLRTARERELLIKGKLKL